MTRVLILAGPADFVARVNVLPNTQVVALARETIENERFDLIRSLDPQSLPDVIFFCEELPWDLTLDVARRTDDAFPTVHLVLAAQVAGDEAVEAMRSGFRDVLPPDAPDERLLEVLRRAEGHRVRGEAVSSHAATPSSSGPVQSRVITIVSPKGGVGKTSIATNMAIGLAEAHPMDVVLVDLDLQFGDVSSALDLVPDHTMEDALTPAAAADNLVLKTMLTVHSAGFYVLCGAESPAAHDRVAGEQIVRLIRQLSMQFPYVVVDTAGGLSEPTLAALECTDDAVIVSTMDVACVRGVRKAVDLLAEIGLLPVSRSLALNLADNQSGLKVKDVEAAVGLPVDVVIPRSSEVQLATNHGQPLMLRKKRKGPFVKAIGDLVDHLERRGAAKDAAHKRLEVA